MGSVILWTITTASAWGDVVLVSVPGSSDPWLAGMPDGSTASFGDVAPAQSPVSVTGLNYADGGVLTFQVSGSVNYGGGPPVDPPDGNVNYVVPHASGAENGMSNVLAPVDALMAVFLGPDQPSLSSPPATLSFSTTQQQDYTSLSPLLQQVFYIGDGLTSGGQTQQIVIPDGATRFFLGTMDGFGWWNNSGSFSVEVTGPGAAAVPEPSTFYALALGASAFALRKRFCSALSRLLRAGARLSVLSDLTR
jgi:hypothetical protein